MKEATTKQLVLRIKPQVWLRSKKKNPQVWHVVLLRLFLLVDQCDVHVRTVLVDGDLLVSSVSVREPAHVIILVYISCDPQLIRFLVKHTHLDLRSYLTPVLLFFYIYLFIIGLMILLF